MPLNENQVPKRTGLLELLRQSVGSHFVIPVYQRNYYVYIRKRAFYFKS